MTDVEKMKARREARMRKILENSENRLSIINSLGSHKAKNADSPTVQVSNSFSTKRTCSEKTEEFKSNRFFLNKDPAEDKLLPHKSDFASSTSEFEPFEEKSSVDNSPFYESSKTLKVKTKPVMKLDGNLISLWIITLIVCIIHFMIKLEPNLFFILDKLKLNMPFIYLLGFEFHVIHKGNLQKNNSLSSFTVFFNVLKNCSKKNYFHVTLKIVKIFSAIMHDVFVFFFLYTLNSIVISLIEFVFKVCLFSENLTNI